MEYKDYLEQAKKYLSSRDGLSSFREYYDKAKNSLQSEYDASKERINDEYVSDVGRAVTQSRMNAKNIDQYMTSRGLARSGEAETERINENLSLNSSLNELAKSKNKALTDADVRHQSAVLELEKELADKEYDESKRLDTLADGIASKQLGIDERAEDIANDKEKTQSEHEYNEYMKRLEAELDELAAKKKREYETQKIADERKYNEQQTAEERAYKEKQTADERAYKEKMLEEERAYEQSRIDDERAYAEKLKENEKVETDGKYTPKQSAESLAKDVVKAYTWSGEKISSQNDRIKVHDFLEEFKSSTNATDKYLNELESALRGMGYKEPGADELTASSLVKTAKSKYDEWYYDAYSTYDGTGLLPLERVEKAKKAVTIKQLDYCWLHTENAGEFECCCDILDISAALRREYESRPLVTDPETGKTTFKKPKGD